MSQAALIIVTSALIAAATAMGLLKGMSRIPKRMSASARVSSPVALIAAVWVCATTFGAAGRAD